MTQAPSLDYTHTNWNLKFIYTHSNHNLCYYRKALWWITFFSYVYAQCPHWLGNMWPLFIMEGMVLYNMQNETAMGTEKCFMITFANSITSTALITGMILYEMVTEWKSSVTQNSYTTVLLNLPWYEITIFSSLITWKMVGWP